MIVEKKHLAVLRGSILFSNMSDGEIQNAVTVMNGRTQKYKKNEFVHGDYEPYLYFGFVLSGTVFACCDDIDGNRIIMAEVSAGKTFGESLCFLKTDNSPVYVCANEDSEILWLSLDNLFVEGYDRFTASLQRRFIETVARRPLEMNKRIQVLSKTKLRDKIITYLSELSDEKGKNIITVPLNREDMANYIGANRTALSRELSLMKKEGILDFHKNTFYILK